MVGGVDGREVGGSMERKMNGARAAGLINI